MAFKEYYETLRKQPVPCDDLRKRIAEGCGVSEKTIYRWLTGEVIPDKLKREKIAEIIGQPVDVLFPNITE